MTPSMWESEAACMDYADGQLLESWQLPHRPWTPGPISSPPSPHTRACTWEDPAVASSSVVKDAPAPKPSLASKLSQAACRRGKCACCPPFLPGRYLYAVLDVSPHLSPCEIPLPRSDDDQDADQHPEIAQRTRAIDCSSLRPLGNLVYPLPQPPQPVKVPYAPSRLLHPPLTPLYNEARTIWHLSIFQLPDHQRYATQHLYVLGSHLWLDIHLLQ